MSLACLDKIIGLSSKDYACFTDTKPDDFNESSSGYFVTDPDYGVEVIEGCEVAGWTLLTNARAMAIRDFKTDLAAKLRDYFDKGMVQFKGFIGELRSAGIALPTKPYIGHQYKPVQMRGVKLVIKNFYVGLDTAGTYPIKIRSNDPTWTPPADVSAVIATGNTFTKITPSAPIDIPFWSDAIDEDFDFKIVLERNGANPLLNVFQCCGSKPAWMKYMTASGIEATTPEGDGITTNSSAEGLVIDGYLTCEELGWICDLSELNGLDVLDLVARTIQFRSGALAIADMVTRQEINLCTLYNLEALQTKRNWNNKQYANNVAWIAQNLPAGVTDCFTCRPEETFYKTDLIV